jgi:hypothetical protein
MVLVGAQVFDVQALLIPTVPGFQPFNSRCITSCAVQITDHQPALIDSAHSLVLTFDDASSNSDMLLSTCGSVDQSTGKNVTLMVVVHGESSDGATSTSKRSGAMGQSKR